MSIIINMLLQTSISLAPHEQHYNNCSRVLITVFITKSSSCPSPLREFQSDKEVLLTASVLMSYPIYVTSCPITIVIVTSSIFLGKRWQRNASTTRAVTANDVMMRL